MKNKESSRYPKRKTLAAVISAAMLASHTTWAQETNSLTLEEIVVTATKRATSMQDIPQSIQAFGTDDIERMGFQGIDDYARKIPGMSLSRKEPGGTSIIFRGVASAGIQYGTNPSSGIYLDEQPITSAGLNPDPRMVDIQRIEALSGPQGTLFGDASQSGTLRIITNKPKTNEFEGWIDGTANSVDGGETGHDISAMVNIPLVEDKVGLRLVGFTAEEAGYVDNVLRSSPGGTFNNADQVETNVNTSTVSGGRAALRWAINEDWTLDGQAIFQSRDIDGFGDVNLDAGDLQQVRYVDEGMSEDWYQMALTLEGSLGFADAVVTASYFDRDFQYESDVTDYLSTLSVDSSYYAYYVSYDYGADPKGQAIQQQDTSRWTMEARLSTPSDSESRWQGMVGFFYNKTETNSVFESTMEGFGDTPGGYYLAGLQYYYTGTFPESSDNYWRGTYDQELIQTAVFSEISFDVTENFTITAGGRWYEIERDFAITQGQNRVGDAINVGVEAPGGWYDESGILWLNDDVQQKESGFVPKLNFTYTIDDDKMVYATYSEGFRAGGGNAVRPTSLISRSYDSDVLENMEIGAKTTWADGRFRLNITAYQMKWNDIQMQVQDPQPFIYAIGIANFPQAEINGIEMDISWIPAEGWEVDASLSDIDAELSSTTELFSDFDSPIVAQSGSQLPITPDMKASLGVQYTFKSEMFGATPYARLDYSHVGDSLNKLEGLEVTANQNPPRLQEAYSISNLKFGLEAESWSATLFVDNAANEQADLFYNNRYGKERLSTNRPRTIGFSFRKHFN